MNILFIVHKYGVPINDPCCYPLGAMYVSAAMKSYGHNVNVLNYNLYDYNLEDELEGIDVAFFTGFEEFFPYIRRDAALIKSRGIKTIVGGALATFAPEMMADICDTVVVGEIEGITEEEINKTGIIRAKSHNINEAHLPDYEGFGIEEYHKRHGLKYMGVLTSRGCPHNCSFCSSTCRFQVRRISSIRSEIELYIEKYDVSHIVFNDNTINVSKDRIIDICDTMNLLGLTWSAAFRLDVFDDDICWSIKNCGCTSAIVGVESFNQKYLDQMNKGLTVDQIIKSLDLLHKYNVSYYGNVLFGLNGQTNNDIIYELSKIPQKYNVFPTMVRHFIGTTEGANLSLSRLEWKRWDKMFKKYIQSKGKYCYPDLQEAI